MSNFSAIKKSQGSLFDDPDFGSLEASRARQANRMEVQQQIHANRKQERLVRLAYRDAVRGGNKQVAMNMLQDAQARGLRPFGIRMAGSDAFKAIDQVNRAQIENEKLGGNREEVAREEADIEARVGAAVGAVREGNERDFKSFLTGLDRVEFGEADEETKLRLRKEFGSFGELFRKHSEAGPFDPDAEKFMSGVNRGFRLLGIDPEQGKKVLMERSPIGLAEKMHKQIQKIYKDNAVGGARQRMNLLNRLLGRSNATAL